MSKGIYTDISSIYFKITKMSYTEIEKIKSE